MVSGNIVKLIPGKEIVKVFELFQHIDWLLVLNQTLPEVLQHYYQPKYL